MSDYKLKRRSAVRRRVTLKDGAKQPIDLTGATVSFIFKREGQALPAFTRVLSLDADDAEAGVATFELLTTDTDFTGGAYGEFLVERGSLREFVPGGGEYITFWLYDSLEALS